MFNSKQELTMAKKPTQAQIIRDYLAVNPEVKIADAAKTLGLKYQRVYMVKKGMDKNLSELAYAIGKGRNRKADWKTLHISTSDNSIEAVMGKELPVTMETSALDVQVAGSHYKDKPIQPVEYISANKLNFLEGCIVKRITRWREKPVEKQFDDLYKIKHEIDLLIEMESKYPKKS
jgi:hypothetical protein